MSPLDPVAVKNQFLCATFNMALHRLAREGEGVLLRASKAPDAFGDRPRTEVPVRLFRTRSLGFR